MIILSLLSLLISNLQDYGHVWILLDVVSVQQNRPLLL